MFFKQFVHGQHVYSIHSTYDRTQIEGQSPMQSVCCIVLCFASIYDVIKGMDGEHPISCQFHFSVLPQHLEHGYPHMQNIRTSFLGSPRVDLVVKVKQHIQLYSSIF